MQSKNDQEVQPVDWKAASKTLEPYIKLAWKIRTHVQEIPNQTLETIAKHHREPQKARTLEQQIHRLLEASHELPNFCCGRQAWWFQEGGIMLVVVKTPCVAGQISLDWRQ